MEQLQSTLVFTFVSLFSMVNPIGMAAVFLAKTKDQATDTRHFLAYKVALYGSVLLIIALFTGPYVLRFFGISLPDIQIAGGIFVFYTAWVILVPPQTAEAAHTEADDGDDIAFFPLTMPITAGAGSLAVTISLSSKIVHTDKDVLAGYAGAVIGIFLVFATVAVCYRFSDAIFRKIGPAGTTVVTRLTAFFLLAIGVEIVWGGLTPLILSLHAR